MVDDTTEPANTVDPLRLDRCPDCGYLLTGLPEQGICPECGFGYDGTSTIVLYGWTGSARGQFGAVRFWPRFMLHMALLPIVLVAWPLIPLRLPAWLPWVLAPNVVALYAWFYQRRRMRMDELPAPTQLRLSPAGFGYRAGHGPCTIRPWQPEMTLSIRPGQRGWHRLQIAGTSTTKVLIEKSWRMQFDLKISPDDARRIVERVEGWRRRAE